MTAPTGAYPVLVAGLRDEKDLIFVQEFVRTNDVLVALTNSGIKDPAYAFEVLAQKVYARPEIRAAIAEVKKVKQQIGDVSPVHDTRDSLIARVNHIHDKALAAEDFNAALNAVREIGTLRGLRVEKKEVTIETKPENMSTAELMKLVQELNKKKPMLDITATDVSDDQSS